MTNNKLLFIREEEDGNIILLRHELQEEAQTGKLSFGQRLLQWFGMLSAVALGAATFAPSALHISSGFRPWIFVSFLLWVVAYCAGMFHP